MNPITIQNFKKEIREELIRDILPFWTKKMVDGEHGGFYGQITGNGQLNTTADKGGILNARILWTFSSAYLLFQDPEYLKTAQRAKEYIFSHFFDEAYGGTYWSLTCDGKPGDTKKQIYSQAFFIYGLSEYFRATGDDACLSRSIELFRMMERYSFDRSKNGYLEAYSADWQLLSDLRLSEKDANEKKTMNTHLHILEAYTNLYRVWKDEELMEQLRNLIRIFTEKIINPETYHLNLFFDEDWNNKSSLISYGHDIEASWLLAEAARVLGDETLIGRVEQTIPKVLEAASEGLLDDGSLIYEKDPVNEHTDGDRHWWVQAEAMVGFINMFEITKHTSYLQKAMQCWEFIKKNLIDPVSGEWFWSVRANGMVNTSDDKAGFWKCPYHNSRACMEIINRL